MECVGVMLYCGEVVAITTLPVSTGTPLVSNKCQVVSSNRITLGISHVNIAPLTADGTPGTFALPLSDPSSTMRSEVKVNVL